MRTAVGGRLTDDGQEMHGGDSNLGKRKRLLFGAIASFLAVIASVTLLEAMSAVYFLYFSDHFYRPIYLKADNIYSWQTEFEPWGAWHKPNATAFHQTACFAIDYTSNSIGARDVERKSPGAPDSAIFLGDSFIEGYGVRDDDRLSNIVERRTKHAAINLAASGDLGPVQYWQVYEAFAPRYAHDTVVIGFLPSNDFTDNDPEYRRWKGQIYRYRPYYKKTDTGYEVFHRGTYQAGRTMDDFNAVYMAGGRSAILRYTWTGGFLFAKRGQLPGRSIDVAHNVSNIGYFESSPARIEAAFYFLDKIVASSPAAAIYILVIPTYSEAKALRTQTSPWLSGFVRRFQSGRVKVLDLGPIFAGMPDDALRRSYLPCDGHWSAQGNAIAAQALLKATQAVGEARAK